MYIYASSVISECPAAGALGEIPFETTSAVLDDMGLGCFIKTDSRSFCSIKLHGKNFFNTCCIDMGLTTLTAAVVRNPRIRELINQRALMEIENFIDLERNQVRMFMSDKLHTFNHFCVGNCSCVHIFVQSIHVCKALSILLVQFIECSEFDLSKNAFLWTLWRLGCFSTSPMDADDRVNLFGDSHLLSHIISGDPTLGIFNSGIHFFGDHTPFFPLIGFS